MVSELRDRNLQRAADALVPLKQALARCLTQMGGLDGDPIDSVLGWIDWNESALAPIVQALGTRGGSGTAVGSVQEGLTGLNIARDAALDMWKGAAANVFHAYSQVVLNNCHEVESALEPM